MRGKRQLNLKLKKDKNGFVSNKQLCTNIGSVSKNEKNVLHKIDKKGVSFKQHPTFKTGKFAAITLKVHIPSCITFARQVSRVTLLLCAVDHGGGTIHEVFLCAITLKGGTYIS